MDQILRKAEEKQTNRKGMIRSAFVDTVQIKQLIVLVHVSVFFLFKFSKNQNTFLFLTIRCFFIMLWINFKTVSVDVGVQIDQFH